ncbi:hypothetical protein [Paenibacillus albiflavus]|nr:hypothetical protein [Paenibacillus albiflavus]
MSLIKGLLITFIVIIVVIISNPFHVRDFVVEKLQASDNNAATVNADK